jgi:hypothetical protein
MELGKILEFYGLIKKRLVLMDVMYRDDVLMEISCLEAKKGKFTGMMFYYILDQTTPNGEDRDVITSLHTFLTSGTILCSDGARMNRFLARQFKAINSKCDSRFVSLPELRDSLMKNVELASGPCNTPISSGTMRNVFNHMDLLKSLQYHVRFPVKNEIQLVQFLHTCSEEVLSQILSLSKAKLIISLRPYSSLESMGSKFHKTPCLGLKTLLQIDQKINEKFT